MMAIKEYFSVGELNNYIQEVISGDGLLQGLPVVGEVSGCSVSGGHCYFTLKDDKAQIKVCLFRCAGKYVPTNGVLVFVNGRVDFYAKKGDISLIASTVAFFGAGALQAQLDALKRRLEQEGVFDPKYKKVLPLFARRVAIITSIKGAAVQDFYTTVRKYNESTDITIIDVRVQGESCVSDVVTALLNADKREYDIIVIARGGGSFEDLYSFNDERLIRTIFAMGTPVISAIGHETDYTLCDFVADERAITPTAAGERIGAGLTALKSKLLRCVEKLHNLTDATLRESRENVKKLLDKMFYNTTVLLEKCKYSIFRLLNDIKLQELHKFDKSKTHISNLLANLELLNPLKLLNNGYFRIMSNQKPLYSIQEINIGDTLEIMGTDGKIHATVDAKGAYGELRKER